eukprot:g2643.t1
MATEEVVQEENKSSSDETTPTAPIPKPALTEKDIKSFFFEVECDIHKLQKCLLSLQNDSRYYAFQHLTASLQSSVERTVSTQKVRDIHNRKLLRKQKQLQEIEDRKQQRLLNKQRKIREKFSAKKKKHTLPSIRCYGLHTATRCETRGRCFYCRHLENKKRLKLQEEKGEKVLLTANIAKTMWKCAECDVFLCNSTKRPCFLAYHTPTSSSDLKVDDVLEPVFTVKIDTDETMKVDERQKKTYRPGPRKPKEVPSLDAVKQLDKAALEKDPRTRLIIVNPAMRIGQRGKELEKEERRKAKEAKKLAKEKEKLRLKRLKKKMRERKKQDKLKKLKKEREKRKAQKAKLKEQKVKILVKEKQKKKKMKLKEKEKAKKLLEKEKKKKKKEREKKKLEKEKEKERKKKLKAKLALIKKRKALAAKKKKPKLGASAKKGGKDGKSSSKSPKKGNSKKTGGKRASSTGKTTSSTKRKRGRPKGSTSNKRSNSQKKRKRSSSLSPSRGGRSPRKKMMVPNSPPPSLHEAFLEAAALRFQNL